MCKCTHTRTHTLAKIEEGKGVERACFSENLTEEQAGYLVLKPILSLHLSISVCSSPSNEHDFRKPRHDCDYRANDTEGKTSVLEGSACMNDAHMSQVCVSVCVCVCALFCTLTPPCTFGETEASLLTPLGIPDAHKITGHFLGVRQEEVSCLKDSWLLQLCILFQIVMFRQFSLFIRFKIDGSQSDGRHGVNKRLHHC